MICKIKQIFNNEHNGDDGLGQTPNAGSLLASREEDNSPNFLPEKYQVKHDDGSLDLENSARKLSEGYNHLERRLGTGDIPPRNADEYQVDLHSELFTFDDFKEHPENQQFLNQAHELGMTQKQVEFVLSEYARRLPELVQVGNEIDMEEAYNELSQTWQTEGEFNKQLRNAYNAFQRYAAPGDLECIDKIGNNPIIVRMLANIGQSLQEDVGIGRPLSVQQEDVRKVMSSEAYRNPSHPDHKVTHERVRRHYEANYGNNIML